MDKKDKQRQSSSSSSSSSFPSSSIPSSEERSTTPVGTTAASVSSTTTIGGGILSSSSSSSLQPPRYQRPPKAEIDYASALPDEMLVRILLFLDIDSGVTSTLTSTRWRPLFTERVCQAHCERVYLDQSRTKRLNPARFNGSWKKMLFTRPRVRTNGLYFLLSSYIKKPMKDMWTEITPGSILEVKYYRYLRFLPNGRLVYALLYLPPSEAVRLFKDWGSAHPSSFMSSSSSLPSSSSAACVRAQVERREGGREGGVTTSNKKKELSEGVYWTHKKEIYCQIRTSYSLINFRLEIGERGAGREGGRGGKFTELAMEEHSSVPYNDPTATPVAHKPAYAPFMFHRVSMW
ncbi:hypothetical protein VYU27_006853 [Nannochloropsis oceanica]